jgi:hypothetical protein
MRKKDPKAVPLLPLLLHPHVLGNEPSSYLPFPLPPRDLLQMPPLDEVGWHTALGGRRVEIPTTRRQWGTAPATFLRYYLHPASAEPTVDAAEGEDTGVYGDKLTAVPQPDIESTTRPEDIDDVLGGQHYFHGATQHALWNLGDYGVVADAWRLFNGPARHLALARAGILGVASGGHGAIGASRISERED